MKKTVEAVSGYVEPQIVPQYKHGKYGTFMFNMCAKTTKFLCRHRFLYYLLACTWGIIMTIAGILVTIVLGIAKLFGAKVTFVKHGFIYGVKCGPDYWGGCETGLMYIRDQKSYNSVDDHEFGHTFQNCLLGPFAIFLCFLPSAARYWYQTIREQKGKSNVPYDSIWFEDAASQCGKYAIAYLKSKNTK